MSSFTNTDYDDDDYSYSDEEDDEEDKDIVASVIDEQHMSDKGDSDNASATDTELPSPDDLVPKPSHHSRVTPELYLQCANNTSDRLSTARIDYFTATQAFVHLLMHTLYAATDTRRPRALFHIRAFQHGVPDVKSKRQTKNKTLEWIPMWWVPENMRRTDSGKHILTDEANTFNIVLKSDTRIDILPPTYTHTTGSQNNNNNNNAPSINGHAQVIRLEQSTILQTERDEYENCPREVCVHDDQHTPNDNRNMSIRLDGIPIHSLFCALVSLPPQTQRPTHRRDRSHGHQRRRPKTPFMPGIVRGVNTITSSSAGVHMEFKDSRIRLNDGTPLLLLDTIRLDILSILQSPIPPSWPLILTRSCYTLERFKLPIERVAATYVSYIRTLRESLEQQAFITRMIIHGVVDHGNANAPSGALVIKDNEDQWVKTQQTLVRSAMTNYAPQLIGNHYFEVNVSNQCIRSTQSTGGGRSTGAISEPEPDTAFQSSDEDEMYSNHTTGRRRRRRRNNRLTRVPAFRGFNPGYNNYNDDSGDESDDHSLLGGSSCTVC